MISAHTCAVFFLFFSLFFFGVGVGAFLTVLWNLEEVSTRDNEEDNVPYITLHPHCYVTLWTTDRFSRHPNEIEYQSELHSLKLSLKSFKCLLLSHPLFALVMLQLRAIEKN